MCLIDVKLCERGVCNLYLATLSLWCMFLSSLDLLRFMCRSFMIHTTALHLEYDVSLESVLSRLVSGCNAVRPLRIISFDRASLVLPFLCHCYTPGSIVKSDLDPTLLP